MKLTTKIENDDCISNYIILMKTGYIFALYKYTTVIRLKRRKSKQLKSDLNTNIDELHFQILHFRHYLIIFSKSQKGSRNFSYIFILAITQIHSNLRALGNNNIF